MATNASKKKPATKKAATVARRVSSKAPASKRTSSRGGKAKKSIGADFKAASESVIRTSESLRAQAAQAAVARGYAEMDLGPTQAPVSPVEALITETVERLAQLSPPDQIRVVTTLANDAIAQFEMKVAAARKEASQYSNASSELTGLLRTLTNR